MKLVIAFSNFFFSEAPTIASEDGKLAGVEEKKESGRKQEAAARKPRDDEALNIDCKLFLDAQIQKALRDGTLLPV